MITDEIRFDVVYEKQTGMHVDKQNGVKATHISTGTVAIVTCHRSQQRNRNAAIRMIEVGLKEPNETR